MKNLQCFLSTNVPLLCIEIARTAPIFVNSKRNYISTHEHYEPKEINWQWTPRCKPVIKCESLCKSRKCPKPSFFPRWKKKFVPSDVRSCYEPPKKEITLNNSSLGEYFSYLLPDSMQEENKKAAHRPAERCRVLAEIRRNKCLDPHSCLCCRHRVCPPSEWYDQAVLHTLLGDGVYPPESRPMCGNRDMEPRPPPSFMVPKCITSLKGLCKMPYKCETTNEALPFKEHVVPVSLPPPKVTPYKFKPKKKVYFMVPDINERAVRLSCKHYADFKTVECPASLFTRYKSVTGTPPGPVEATCESHHVRPQTEPPVCPTTGCPMVQEVATKPKKRSFHTYLSQNTGIHSSATLGKDDEDEEDRVKRCTKEKRRKKCDIIYNDVVENKKCIIKNPKDKCDKELFKDKKNDPYQPPGCSKCQR